MKLYELKKELEPKVPVLPLNTALVPRNPNLALVRFPRTDSDASLQAALREMEEMDTQNLKYLSGKRYTPPLTRLVVDEVGVVTRQLRRPDAHLGAVEL